MKICKKCNQAKDLDLYHKSKTAKDGLHSYCKACTKEAAYKWRRENPEKHKAGLRASYKKHKEKRAQYDHDYIQRTKDGLYHVYVVEDYAGMTSNPWHRRKHHRSRHGRDMDSFRVIYSTPDKFEALELEELLHDLGYEGRHHQNRNNI